MTGGWLVVRVRPQLLARALVNMRRQGCECYAPEARVRRRGRPAREALFPGYAFARHPEGRWAFLRGTYGVIEVLMESGVRPAEIADADVAAIRSREGPDGLVQIAPALAPGARVSVARGSARIDAVVEGMSGPDRVLVLMEILGARRRVEVGVADLS